MNPIFSISDDHHLLASAARGGNIFSSIDISFGRFLERISGESNPCLFAAAALVSMAVREGNVCLDLHNLPLIEGLNLSGTSAVKDWQHALQKSSVVGKPGEIRPLILDDALRLYLFRYWEYEKELLDFLIETGKKTDFEWIRRDWETCKRRLDRLFPDSSAEEGMKGEVNLQKVAACSVLSNKLAIISGGPGTGKTLTIARAIILLLELSDARMLRVALAAPTGKAARRLQEAILDAAEIFVEDDKIRAAIPKQAMTIHRLIGGAAHSSRFRRNRENPLPFDMVVIDEASMVDLPLMVRLIRAMPEHARLVLLGDRDQLASVEAGAVLGDICGYRQLNDFSADSAASLSPLVGEKVKELPLPPLTPPSPLRNSLIELTRNYRFSGQSRISRLSSTIKRGDGTAAFSVLRDTGDDSCRWSPLPRASELPLMIKDIISRFKEYFYHIDNRSEYEGLFDIFDRFRILCALRHGPYGAIEVNRLCEEMLYREGAISAQEPFYPGRPVMITINDYTMKLFNGDTGFILPDPEREGGLSAFFRSQSGELRRFSPFRLPEHETLYAMTVHKSQGSEFDHVLLILPDYDAPVLTRELIYTAVTRARKTVTIWGNENIFIGAVSRRMKRSSGLRDALGMVS
jgi:exodeoxyribonuclease V alpha subunit